jgi:hypothetical protein
MDCGLSCAVLLRSGRSRGAWRATGWALGEHRIGPLGGHCIGPLGGHCIGPLGGPEGRCRGLWRRFGAVVWRFRGGSSWRGPAQRVRCVVYGLRPVLVGGGGRVMFRNLMSAVIGEAPRADAGAGAGGGLLCSTQLADGVASLRWSCWRFLGFQYVSAGHEIDVDRTFD